MQSLCEHKTVTVALYYWSLEHSGGIENVVVEQTRIFSENGYSCLLLTNEKPVFYSNRIKCPNAVLSTDAAKRQSQWEQFIEDFDIKYVILNSAVDNFVKEDIENIHQSGAKVINTVHFSFPCPLLFNEAWESFSINLTVGKMCDAVATVSGIDALWWRALGCNAYYVQNPLTINTISDQPKKYTNHTMIWVGRGVAQKQPEEAIYVLHNVVKVIPDAKLIMVGLEDAGKSYRKLVKRLKLENNILFVPPTSEIAYYYQQASLHLLTSITESFCIVIAEAKSQHIPTVMYDIPFLELIEDGKGVKIVEQRNSKVAAEKIVELFLNPDVLKAVGDEAYSTLSKFSDEEVVSRWQAIFTSLDKGEKFKPNFMDPNEIIVREIYSAWMNHCRQNVWKINFFDNIERATGHSAKSLINGIVNIIIEPLKRLKRKIR
ncbi:MAG: glycosyltransferase [Ruminococcus flavefaciens]|nr:glycosyltransferase [Bacteroides sp.]MCM1233514.1 glycosyltransferase [Ruminococcus flavefaciens]